MAEISFDEQATVTAKKLVESFDILQRMVQGLEGLDHGGPDDELANTLNASFVSLRGTLTSFTSNLEKTLADIAEDVRITIAQMREHDEALVAQLDKLAAEAANTSDWSGTDASVRVRERKASPTSGGTGW